MGISIHYAFQLADDDRSEALRLVEQLRECALDLPLRTVGDVIELEGEGCDHEKYDVRAEPVHSWLLIQAERIIMRKDCQTSVKPEHVIAFNTWPGEGCEAANFGLCRYPAVVDVDGREAATGLTEWSWRSFCKTHYASNPDCGGIPNFLRCHLSIVKILDHAKSLGILDDLKDEGGFWKNRDPAALVERVVESSQALAAFVGAFKDMLGGDGDVVARITEYPDFEHLEADAAADRE